MLSQSKGDEDAKTHRYAIDRAFEGRGPGRWAGVVPSGMNKAAAARVGSSLIARKLKRELRTKPGMPIWREDADGRSISLIITRAGQDAAGVDEPEEEIAKGSSEAAGENTDTTREATSGAPREGSKQALVVAMLSKRGGATLDQLIEATGWLPHTTRAAVTGLRKRGFAIERIRSDGKESIYRIVAASKLTAEV